MNFQEGTFKLAIMQEQSYIAGQRTRCEAVGTEDTLPCFPPILAKPFSTLPNVYSPLGSPARGPEPMLRGTLASEAPTVLGTRATIDPGLARCLGYLGIYSCNLQSRSFGT